MEKHEEQKPDIIDEDLYEEFDDEELYEIVQEARKEALIRATMENKIREPKRPFPKWMFWLIAITLVLNIIALLPTTFSIPAIDFLITSAKLSTKDDIQSYKEAVVVIEAGESKGTGFAISSDGYILTNYHVVDEGEPITVAFPDNGLFHAEIKEEYPEVDLALLKTNSNIDLPFLNLAEETTFDDNDKITFIGNPLKFNGIANEGTIIGLTELKSWDKPVVMIKAPVYRGNSGSPIINQEGEVIGVIFATLNHDGHGKVGLFVPIDYFHEKEIEIIE